MREISEQIAALAAEVKAMRVEMRRVVACGERTAKIMGRASAPDSVALTPHELPTHAATPAKKPPSLGI